MVPCPPLESACPWAAAARAVHQGIGGGGPTKRFSALPRPKILSGWSSLQLVKAAWGALRWFRRSGRLPQVHSFLSQVVIEGQNYDDFDELVRPS